MSQKTKNGFELWTVDEVKNNKNLYGKEYLQSINGNTSSSALRIIDDWMNTINAMMGRFALNTDNKTVTGAINELKIKSDKQIENVSVNGTILEKQNNKVNITVPTKTSDITNDSHINIVTTEDIVDTTAIGFGDTITVITEVNRDDNGHVENIKTIKSTFPIVTTNPNITGNGNAVTSLDVNNGIINLKKEETFATTESHTATILSGFTGSVKATKIGNVVLVNGSVSSNGGGNSICYLPASFHPTEQVEISITVKSDGYYTINVYVGTDGCIKVSDFYPGESFTFSFNYTI